MRVQKLTINMKKAGVAILISGKVDFQTKKSTRETEKYFIVIKGSLHQKDITVLKVFIISKRTAKYVKQKLIELQRQNRKILSFSLKNSIILSQNLIEQVRKNAIDQLDFVYISSTFYPTAEHSQCIFTS